MPPGPVLAIGLDPDTIPGYDPAPVWVALAAGRRRFAELDIEFDECLLALDEHIETRIAAALGRRDYACVVIGGGIRKPAELLELFETTVNLVRRHAPGAAIAFNTSPVDTADAAARWLGGDSRR